MVVEGGRRRLGVLFEVLRVNRAGPAAAAEMLLRFVAVLKVVRQRLVGWSV